MARREIDPNLFAHKGSRKKTAIVTFTDRRFKIFLYKTRKRLSTDGEQICSNLFLNDHLTPYNYNLLMTLKREITKMSTEMSPNFESVYSIEGKVFVKIKRSSPNADAIWIKSTSNIENFLKKLNEELSSDSSYDK